MKRALLALLVLVFACGQDDCVQVGVVDEGFHVAEDGVELYPSVLPAAIAIDTTMTDVTLLPEALDQWNAWLSRDGVQRTVLVPAEEGETPRVLVSVGFTGTPDWGTSLYDAVNGVETADRTSIDYAEDGEVLGAEIVLSSDVEYDRPTMLMALLHSLGHAPLGLEDDPGPPTTVDLRSAMAKPMDPLGELTDSDFALLLPYLEGL